MDLHLTPGEVYDPSPVSRDPNSGNLLWLEQMGGQFR
jgi:hypothetical protein